MQKRMVYAGSCLVFCLTSLVLIFLPNPPLPSAENGSTLTAGSGWRDTWYDIALSPAGQIWGASSAGIFKSSEAVKGNWQKLPAAGNSYYYSIKVGQGTIWACGEKGLVVFSSDGGKSWREKSLGDFALLDI